MIVKIPYKSKIDGKVKLHKTYSDRGVQIRKVGTDEVYDEAIDVESALYVYEETDIQIER